jgi:hypothetical protein
VNSTASNTDSEGKTNGSNFGSKALNLNPTERTYWDNDWRNHARMGRNETGWDKSLHFLSRVSGLDARQHS